MNTTHNGMNEITVEEFLTPYTLEVRQLVQKTRHLVLDTIPNVLEMVDPPSKIIAYGRSTKYSGLICAIAPYKSYLNLIFSRGTELPDPDGLLLGTGKRARHIRIQREQDLLVPGVRALIQSAMDKIPK